MSYKSCGLDAPFCYGKYTRNNKVKPSSIYIPATSKLTFILEISLPL